MLGWSAAAVPHQRSTLAGSDGRGNVGTSDAVTDSHRNFFYSPMSGLVSAIRSIE